MSLAVLTCEERRGERWRESSDATVGAEVEALVQTCTHSRLLQGQQSAEQEQVGVNREY